ncbi:MAG: NADH-quinone oxidoreductase subunit M, partial [Rhodospirillaceae bacterium]|nr:NADH-quinone oxidoreductase subunit M [Rhodospirillaceae bacterium]
MYDWPLLSIAIFLPLVGAVAVLLIRNDDEAKAASNARYTALWTSVFVLIVSVAIWIMFDPSTAEFQFVEQKAWIPSYGIQYYLGIDGISLFLIILAAFLTPVCILCSWEAIQKRVKEYMVAFLVMESLMIGVFSSLDFVLFYLFFEAMLIPMFLIIGVWGGPRRIYAAFKFFLYTLVGSVLLLVALLVMYFEAGTTSIPDLMNAGFGEDMQRWLWLAMFASFAV